MTKKDYVLHVKLGTKEHRKLMDLKKVMNESISTVIRELIRKEHKLRSS